MTTMPRPFHFCSPWGSCQPGLKSEWTPCRSMSAFKSFQNNCQFLNKNLGLVMHGRLLVYWKVLDVSMTIQTLSQGFLAPKYVAVSVKSESKAREINTWKISPIKIKQSWPENPCQQLVWPWFSSILTALFGKIDWSADRLDHHRTVCRDPWIQYLGRLVRWLWEFIVTVII